MYNKFRNLVSAKVTAYPLVHFIVLFSFFFSFCFPPSKYPLYLFHSPTRLASLFVSGGCWNLKVVIITLGTRGFSRVRWEFAVLAEGRHIFGRSWSHQRRCFLPSPLTFELFYPITFTPIRMKVSNRDHVGLHVKKCPKTHINLRKTTSSLKFIASRAIMTGSHRNSP